MDINRLPRENIWYHPIDDINWDYNKCRELYFENDDWDRMTYSAIF